MTCDYERLGYALIESSKNKRVRTFEKQIRGYWLRFHVGSVPRAEVVQGGISLHFPYRTNQHNTVETIELQVQKVMDAIKNVGLVRTAESSVNLAPEEIRSAKQ